MTLKQVALPFLFCLLTAGCFQTENSSSGDSGPTAVGSPEFIAASNMMARKCTSCHYHVYHTRTEAQLIAQGLVVPGDPEASEIYYRLTGSSGPGGPKDMPDDGPLTPTEMAIMVTWINSIPL